MTELPSLRPERPLGMWAFWSSLATLFLFASTILFFGLGFCIGIVAGVFRQSMAG